MIKAAFEIAQRDLEEAAWALRALLAGEKGRDADVGALLLAEHLETFRRTFRKLD